MRFNRPEERRRYYRTRAHHKRGQAANPTFYMMRTNTDTGAVEQYIPPGVWKTVNGGFADWNNIANKPAVFPPAPHTHVIADITDFNTHTHVIADITDLPGGTWAIPPGIADPNVATALNNLNTLLQSAGIIT